MKTRAEGFTIVELLIVIVVIAILAAITIVSYNGIASQSKNTTTLATIDSWSKKLAMTKGAGVTLADTAGNPVCVGLSTDYPAAGVFANQECVRIDVNGANALNYTYGASAFSGMTGAMAPVSGKTTEASATGTSGGVEYRFTARGAWLTVISGVYNLNWVPAQPGKCGKGTIDASLGAQVCTLRVN